MKELIEALCSVYGPSGQEKQIREAIAEQLAGVVDELHTDNFGNLSAIRRPSGSSSDETVATCRSCSVDSTGRARSRNAAIAAAAPRSRPSRRRTPLAPAAML